MGRIVALDIGRKRTGIAATDPLQIIANGIATVATAHLFDFFASYIQENPVELVVIGMPKQMNNEPSEAVKYIEPVINRFKKLHPQIPIKLVDERFTSKIAFQTMLDGGVKKMDRRDKAMVDTISATIILQSYLESLDFDKQK
ncbi:Holliday junction resolvase RuvX [Perlabentimonas gracilis]|uniref:Holliday junction resolvase RuvX n=1 Tax=Perlabentimonas gracilis TaxID=2715279 RepID=UPI00140BDE72|nr:Holliday junction resolvase RuvX [Perlabentimonas gracilis]NHB67404.1 Holliday junction resolvase RuvX [Perlabentimonas gracilis]